MKRATLSFVGVPALDYGARLYSTRTGQWVSPDPLGEEYRSVSPYVYCTGNPVDFVDVEGKKLYYAPGTSDKFKEQFSATESGGQLFYSGRNIKSRI